MNAKKILGLVSGLLILAGAIVGFVPVSSQGANCGSAFVKSNDAFVSDLTNSMTGYGSINADDSCDSLRHIIMIPSIVLLAIGLVLMFVAAAMVSYGQPKTVEKPETEDSRSA